MNSFRVVPTKSSTRLSRVNVTAFSPLSFRRDMDLSISALTGDERGIWPEGLGSVGCHFDTSDLARRPALGEKGFRPGLDAAGASSPLPRESPPAPPRMRRQAVTRPRRSRPLRSRGRRLPCCGSRLEPTRCREGNNQPPDGRACQRPVAGEHHPEDGCPVVVPLPPRNTGYPPFSVIVIARTVGAWRHPAGRERPHSGHDETSGGAGGRSSCWGS